jgi:lantibiotic modifying enzyme
MSRLRAFEILRHDSFREQATVAIKTTVASLESAIEGWTGNFSLCHGLAGNGEVLLYAAELIPSEAAETILLRIAYYGIERFAQGKSSWPCGTHSGVTPNLMLGLAGIGQFYLRLCEPSIPSILILRKDMWENAGGFAANF